MPQRPKREAGRPLAARKFPLFASALRDAPILSLEAWPRSEPHRLWWQKFLKDSGGTGFWHETYLRRGGIEAVYIDMESSVGLARFAPKEPARGAMFSARRRAGIAGAAKQPEALTEDELYSE
jgi:fumigallin biosynthesis monooxygenase-like protein